MKFRVDVIIFVLVLVFVIAMLSSAFSLAPNEQNIEQNNEAKAIVIFHFNDEDHTLEECNLSSSKKRVAEMKETV